MQLWVSDIVALVASILTQQYVQVGTTHRMSVLVQTNGVCLGSHSGPQLADLAALLVEIPLLLSIRSLRESLFFGRFVDNRMILLQRSRLPTRVYIRLTSLHLYFNTSVLEDEASHDGLGITVALIICNPTKLRVMFFPLTKSFRTCWKEMHASRNRSSYAQMFLSSLYGQPLYQLRLLMEWVGALTVGHQRLFFLVMVLQSLFIWFLKDVPLFWIHKALRKFLRIGTKMLNRKRLFSCVPLFIDVVEFGLEIPNTIRCKGLLRAIGIAGNYEDSTMYMSMIPISSIPQITWKLAKKEQRKERS